MRQSLLLPLLLLLFSLPVLAQQKQDAFRHTLEGGIMLGVTGYSGDISAKQIDFKEIQPGYGAFIRYQMSNHFALKSHFYAGTISGDDKYSDIKAPRKLRFGSSLLELASTVEWQLLGHRRISDQKDFFITPYIFAGLSLTFADANVEYYGLPEHRDKFLVAPLPEENLKKTFLLTPAGGGIRMVFYERFIFGLEGGFRPAFSDDIDGVSLNGNPDRNDWYYFFGLTASFVLNEWEK